MNIENYFTSEHKDPKNYKKDFWYLREKLNIPEEDKNMHIFLYSGFDNKQKLNFIIRCIKGNEYENVVVRFLNANKDNVQAMNYIWTEINKD